MTCGVGGRRRRYTNTPMAMNRAAALPMVIPAIAPEESSEPEPEAAAVEVDEVEGEVVELVEVVDVVGCDGGEVCGGPVVLPTPLGPRFT